MENIVSPSINHTKNAIVIEIVYYWNAGTQTDQWKKIKSVEINPHTYGQ